MLERLVWLVPIAVATLGAWRPRAGLLILAAALPLFGSPPGGPYLGALEAAGIAAVVTAWRGGRPEPSPLVPAMTAFLAISLVSLLPSPYLPPSWRPADLLDLARAFPGVANWGALYTWRAAADLVVGCALFLAVRRAFAGRSCKPLALALLAGLAATLVAGLAEIAGLVNLDAYRPIQGFRVFHRLHSFFFLSGWLSEYIVMATPFALAVAASARGRRRLWAVALLALATAGLALTFQRGAWVAAAAQAACLAVATRSLWLRNPVVLRRAALAVTVALAASLLIIGLGDRLDPMLERAASIRTGVASRASLWSAAAEMCRQRPLLGWGLGSFTPAFDALHPDGSPGARRFRGTAHNLYLHVAAERGVLGLAALGLLGWAAAACLRRPRPGQEAAALGIGLSLAGTAVYGLVQYMFHLRNISWLFWILLGCLAVVTRPGPRLRLERLSRGLVGVALVLVPFRLALNEPPALQGDRMFGFHAIEGPPGETFRWTEGVATRRLPWSGETLVLSFANGHPLGAERPVAVTVRVDGATVAALEIRGGWQQHRFPLGPPSAESILLTLEARPTFRPFSDLLRYAQIKPRARRSGDIRSLGVAVREPHWEGGAPAP